MSLFVRPVCTYAPLVNRATEKLFLESIKFLKTVISSLVRLWTLLNNVHFDFNSILDITSKIKNDVLIHIVFYMGVEGLIKPGWMFP